MEERAKTTQIFKEFISNLNSTFLALKINIGALKKSVKLLAHQDSPDHKSGKTQVA
jgi:hypothetical protein